ncbi:hypothetical protein RRG08_062694 [Elysia crispata]|uniref:Uncharacterized protein n=1 Tax=Elysia crispata TaxID=231223 RepID=A0AAE1DVX2_9GAST|nr:hypothetical protein RRG08_062694 [Elysia crispata]
MGQKAGTRWVPQGPGHSSQGRGRGHTGRPTGSGSVGRGGLGGRGIDRASCHVSVKTFSLWPELLSWSYDFGS